MCGRRGAVDSTYTVKVSDEIPPGEPGRMIPHVAPYGLNVAMLNLYVPKRAHFQSVSPNYQQFPTDFIIPDAYVKYVRPRGFRQHIEGLYRVFTQTVTPYPGIPEWCSSGTRFRTRSSEPRPGASTS